MRQLLTSLAAIGVGLLGYFVGWWAGWRVGIDESPGRVQPEPIAYQHRDGKLFDPEDISVIRPLPAPYNDFGPE